MGLGFRDYDECLKYIRQSNSIKAPKGGVALPLPYTVYERPTYSVVPSNAVWRTRRVPTQRRSCARTRRATGGGTSISRSAARRAAHRRVLPRPLATSPNAWTGSASRWRTRVQMLEHLRCGRGGARVLSGDREAAARVLPGATMRWSTTTTFSTRTTRATARKTRTQQPGVNANYANLVHQRPERQQRPRALPRAAHPEPAEFRAHSALHGGRGRQEDVAAVHVDQPRQADRDGRAVPFVLCAWPPSPTSLHTTTGSTTTASGRPPASPTVRPRVVLVSPAEPTEVSMLKCYDSVTDGSVSRWSFHTACVDPTAPLDADAARTSWSGPLSSSRRTGRGSGQRSRHWRRDTDDRMTA